MSTQTFVVNISNQPVVVRVSQTSFGQARIMGGVPGPQGPPGLDGASDAGLMTTHIADPTPHPAYDDLPSLAILFENGLV